MSEFTLAEVLAVTKGNLLNGRIKQQAVTFGDIATDSRKIASGELFIALRGEKFDGSVFVAKAIAGGAAGVVLSRAADKNILAELKEAAVPVIIVEDTLVAYQALANYHRRRFSLPIVAVTGSNGKTTTKDIISAIFSGKYSTAEILKTEANYNNEVGLPLTLLNLNERHRVAVIEMGMRGLGQIEVLTAIAEPTAGIITNVGETHMELLGSIDNIAKAKGELVEGLKSDSLAVLNADDFNSQSIKASAGEGVKVITFGIGEEADIRAEGIRLSREGVAFSITYANERHEYKLPLVGRHNIYNALAGIGTALYLGLSPQEIQRGLRNIELTHMRYEQIELHGWHIINDAYNASPLSMKVAIETTADIYKGRKIAVLADMLELGDIAVSAHRQVGAMAFRAGFDTIITYGNMGREIKKGAEAAGVVHVYHGESYEEIADYIRGLLKPDDALLIKGSRGMELENILKLLSEE